MSYDPETDMVQMALHESRVGVRDARTGDLRRAHLSLVGQLGHLTLKTKVGLVGLGVTTGLLTLWHWQLVLAMLLLLIPTLGQLVRWWRWHPAFCPLDVVLAHYLYGVFGLGIFVTGIAAGVSTLFVGCVDPFLNFFWLVDTDILRRTGQCLDVAIRWTVFCFIDELLLLATLRRAQRRQSPKGQVSSSSSSSSRGGEEHVEETTLRRTRAYTLYGSASAIGYATAQCVALACLVTALMEGQQSILETKIEARNEPDQIHPHAVPWVVCLTFAFVAFWLPLRLAAAHLTVLGLARHPDLVDDPSWFPLSRSCTRYGRVLGDDDEVPFAANPVDPPEISAREAATDGSIRVATTGYSFNSRSHRQAQQDAQRRRNRGCLCCLRCRHLVSIIKWSWLLRAAHLTQFAVWFYVMAIPINSANVISWLVMTFIFWTIISTIAIWKVKVCEYDLQQHQENRSSIDTVATVSAIYGITFAPQSSDDDDDLDDDLEEALLQHDHGLPSSVSSSRLAPTSQIQLSTYENHYDDDDNSNIDVPDYETEDYETEVDD